MYQRILACLLCALSVLPVCVAQSRRNVDRTTDVMCLVPVAGVAAAAWLSRDGAGAGQAALAEGTALAANYLLELCVKKNRPDGSGQHAFPSTHCAISASAATSLWIRYGWKWGVPAAAVAGYVAWGRIYARKHDAWDVLAGTAIGIGSAFAFVRRSPEGSRLTLQPLADPLTGTYALTARLEF